MDDLANGVEQFDRAVLDRDVELADRVLHPGFALELVHPSSQVLPRESWLTLLPDYVVSAWEVHELTLGTHGDVGAVLRSVTMAAVVAGADRSGRFVMSDVWCREDGRWRVWRRHSTPMTAGSLRV